MTSNRRMRLPRRADAASLAERLLPELAGGCLPSLPVAVRFWDGTTLAGTGAPRGTALRPERMDMHQSTPYRLSSPPQV